MVPLKPAESAQMKSCLETQLAGLFLAIFSCFVCNFLLEVKPIHSRKIFRTINLAFCRQRFNYFYKVVYKCALL